MRDFWVLAAAWVLHLFANLYTIRALLRVWWKGLNSQAKEEESETLWVAMNNIFFMPVIAVLIVTVYSVVIYGLTMTLLIKTSDQNNFYVGSSVGLNFLIVMTIGYLMSKYYRGLEGITTVVIPPIYKYNLSESYSGEAEQAFAD